MIADESTLSERPVLRITATYFSFFSYFRPIFIVFQIKTERISPTLFSPFQVIRSVIYKIVVIVICESELYQTLSIYFIHNDGVVLNLT